MGYQNSCDTSIYHSVPYNYIGGKLSFQYAKTGNAYVLNDIQNGGTRGYMQSKLKDSLKHYKKYYVEFFVNIPNGIKNACNNIALLLTNNAVYVDTIATPYGVLPANPQIYNYGNPVLGDTLNWTKISAVYKAQGGEQFITLGNFKDDANTIMQQIQPTGYYGAKYYIDDVSVIPLDSMCLKADAGKDIIILQGDSAFIGSYTNGIDSLLWLQNGITQIDSTRPGFYVHPSLGTTYYVLHQIVNGCYSSDTVYVNVVLPLKFINYNVISTKEKSIQSIWTTATEVNVNYFNIQRSTNAKVFTTIGTIKANNKNYNEYSFTDENANNGMNYYRIESVDRDGKKQYSTIKSVQLKVNSSISIYPNPAKDIANISCVGIKEVQIFDLLGKLITTQKCNNDNIITIKLNNVNAGIYVVKVTNAKGEIKNTKLIIE